MPSFRHQCEFRFYEELGDFLPPDRRKRSFTHAFDGTPAVKDRIEALGVPHTEVDLILVDGVSVTFAHRLQGGERVAVYPVFERFELADACRLRPRPLREPRFVLDVHLGRLAAYLRLLGFDCLYRNDFGDEELLAISRTEHRILLSRDTSLLKRAALTHGAFVYATDPRRQLREVCDRFQLDARIAPFTRCARCNGSVEPLPGHQLADAVPQTIARQQRGSGFSRCCTCGQIYWPGSHLVRLRQRLAEVGVAI
ncbi:MAG TPA: Mut7-C RNAse domain-containing protein [Lysobacter sp.]|nr:Mut7-C RNAse domain-containing protein [Lysobacter sp.]